MNLMESNAIWRFPRSGMIRQGRQRLIDIGKQQAAFLGGGITAAENEILCGLPHHGDQFGFVGGINQNGPKSYPQAGA